MAEAHLDLQLEPSSSDLTTETLFIDSPVLFVETIDQVNAHPSEEIEGIEHTTPTKVHTPPDTTHEVPPPPKKRYEITNILSFSPHVYFLLKYPLNHHFLQLVMIT